RMAIDLEPVSHFNQRYYGNALYLARRYDEAAVQWRRLIERDPTDFVPYNQLIRTLEAQGKYSEAFEWLIKLLILRNKGSEIIQHFTNIYQTSGWRGVLLERVKYTEWGLGNAQDFLVAGSYAQAGEKNKAFEHLEKAYQRREWTMLQLQVHPQLDPIRNDPRFAHLIRRVEMK
ncbi:MAG: TPR end-of-group domain-containing protein, partial [Microcoleus sp.]